MYGLLVKSSKSRARDMYASSVESEEAKAERILRKFSRHVEVRRGHSTMFLYSERPFKRDLCMKCIRQGKNLCANCSVDRVVEEVLIGLKVLEYAHIKAKIVFPAP